MFRAFPSFTLLLLASCLKVPADASESSTNDSTSTSSGETEPTETTTTGTGACGDGVVDPGEACDDDNSVDEDECPSGPKGQCQAKASCGDGIVWAGEEACDGGEGCSEVCELLGECGNGVMEPGEACDDNNTEDEDACPSGEGACKAVATCGDGYTWAGNEVCDDGNTDDDDGCPSGEGGCAAKAKCGDGFVEVGVEECDDANEVDEDACPSGVGACMAEASCGDGFVWDGVEGCDDMNGEDLDECSDQCATPRWVFVTSNNGFNGNLGGVVGADAYCQGLAAAASLPGTYMAWLTDSDPNSAPAMRFGSQDFKGWYRLRTNPPTGVAEGWADLTGVNDDVPKNYLQKAISVDEQGKDVDDSNVWTNTDLTGAQFGPETTCEDWTKANAGFSGAMGHAFFDVLDKTWTENITAACNFGARVYCFQIG